MAKAKSVLIVEDEDEIRSMIVSTLRDEAEESGLVIVEAKDGREAINFAGRQEFSCIVTDLSMPRTNGEELIQYLLADGMNANTPMIVVSGNLSDDFLRDFKNARSIPKPFAPFELAQSILREVKLGRMDERVPVHLLNPVLESLQKILVDEMQLGPSACELRSPTVRKHGDKIEGDLHVLVTLTTGLTQARISLTFSREWLRWLKENYFATRREQWAGMSPETTAKQAAFAVIEKAQSHLASIMGAPPRVAEIFIFDLDDPIKAHEAAKSAGVVVTLHTDQGQVLACAVPPNKVKRAVS